jgi:hypothetical protein
LTINSHIAAKCQSSAPPSQPPSVMLEEKLKVEQRRGVVDLPSRHDHQNHREGVGPVQRPHPGRLDDFGLGWAACSSLTVRADISFPA